MSGRCLHQVTYIIVSRKIKADGILYLYYFMIDINTHYTKIHLTKCIIINISKFHQTLRIKTT